MEFITQFAGAALLFIASLTGGAGDTLAPTQPTSVELGLYEVSPRGEAGGFAIPASGCSPASPSWHGYPIHDCTVYPDITADKLIVRYGEDVEVSWNPYSHVNCVLSETVMVLTPLPDGDVADSRIDEPTGETTYSIVCDGAGNRDSVTVKVLPRFQET